MRDERAKTTLWISFAVGAMFVLIMAVGLIATMGVPGSTGGTSPSQQQTSGAQQPQNEIRDGHTRQNTTGYGSKANQPAR